MSFGKYVWNKVNPFYKPKFKIGDTIYNKDDKPFKDEPAKHYYVGKKVADGMYKLEISGLFTQIRCCRFVDSDFELEENK
jgi:hypothetical protein